MPLLLTWLVLDRCPPRWYTVVAVGLLLTWVLIADPLALLVGVAPLVAVCALRAFREARRQDGRLRAVLRANWYELSLAVAAIAAQGLASLAGRLLQAYLHPVPYQLAPLRTWPKHAYVTAKGLLALFGAKPEGPPAALAFSLLHLAGVVLVAWAAWRVARHFLSWPDMISQILLVAMVLNVAAYVPSTLANATDLNAREFAIVLPYGAVLAGRTLAASLLGAEAPGAAGRPGRRPDRRRPAGRLRGQPRLGRRPAAGPPDERAAGHLPRGPPPDQRDRRLLGIERGHGGQRRRRHDPGRAARHAAAGPVGSQGPPGTTPAPSRANFLVTSKTPGFFHHWQPDQAALAALGRPARTYHTGPYTVYVYDKNLLAELPRS